MTALRLGGLLLLAAGVSLGAAPCDIGKLRATTEASAALDRIVGAVGFDPGTILLYASSDPLVVQKGGAMSLACNFANGTERWIVYDPDLIPAGQARDFVFAHEIAHHASFQPLLAGEWSKAQELTADYFGAEYLVRLNWTKEQLSRALDDLKLPQTSQQGYPTLDERRAKVIAGYTDETERRGTTASGNNPPAAASPGKQREKAQASPQEGPTAMNPQTASARSDVFSRLHAPFVRDLPSDLKHVAELAPAHRLRELKDFVVNGATSCYVQTGDAFSVLFCRFPADRFSAEGLKTATDAAFSGLSWKQLSDGSAANLYGDNPLYVVDITLRTRSAPEIEFYVREKGVVR